MSNDLERYSQSLLRRGKTVDYIPPAEPTEYPGMHDKPTMEYLMGVEPRRLLLGDRLHIAGMTYEVLGVNTSYDTRAGYRYTTHIVLSPAGLRTALEIYALPMHVFNVIRKVE